MKKLKWFILPLVLLILTILLTPNALIMTYCEVYVALLPPMFVLSIIVTLIIKFTKN